jgi:hypothetical protein
MLRHRPCARRWPGSHHARASPVIRRPCTLRHSRPCSAAYKESAALQAAQADELRVSIIRPPVLSPLAGKCTLNQRGTTDRGCHAKASTHQSTAVLQEGIISVRMLSCIAHLLYDGMMHSVVCIGDMPPASAPLIQCQLPCRETIRCITQRHVDLLWTSSSATSSGCCC